MSLLIAAAGIDGVVLASDSRVTEGYTPEGPKTRDDSVKFIQLGPDWGILTYGLSEIGHAGISALKEEVSQAPMVLNSGKALTERGKQLLQRISLEWGSCNQRIKRRSGDVGFVIGGYERETNAFRIFNLQSPDFAAASPRNGCMVAGQWHVAKYFLAKLYSKDLALEKLKQLAVFLLDATMKVDKQVGGPIRLAAVSAASGFTWASDAEVGSLMSRNRLYHDFLCDHFACSVRRAAGGA